MSTPLSTSVIADAATELEQALQTLDGFGVYRDPGATLSLPALVIGPPSLLWETGCLGPTSARFLVYVVVDADERAIERLWAYVPAVAETIDDLTRAAVVRADPAVYVSGGVSLPCYELQTEATL